jgi:hypothetical protein
MVPNQVQERLVANKLSRAVDGVAVASRACLWNKPHGASQASGSLCVSSLITGPHHDTNLPDVCGEGLLDEDTEHGFLNPVVDQSLQWKGTLIRSRRSDDRFPDPQFGCSSSVASQQAA